MTRIQNNSVEVTDPEHWFEVVVLHTIVCCLVPKHILRVQEGSRDYDEFWKFLRKYQEFEKKRPKGRRRRAGSGGRVSEVLELPAEYNKEDGCCFSLLPADPADLLNRISFQDEEGSSVLTRAAVLEFRHILHTFLSFQQREKMARLRKLREGQASLPIAAYREEILEQLEGNQVVIVAGDTGCGKSTQVPQYLLQANITNFLSRFAENEQSNFLPIFIPLFMYHSRQ